MTTKACKGYMGYIKLRPRRREGWKQVGRGGVLYAHMSIKMTEASGCLALDDHG